MLDGSAELLIMLDGGTAELDATALFATLEELKITDPSHSRSKKRARWHEGIVTLKSGS